MANKNKVMVINTKPYNEFVIGDILSNYGLELVHDHNANVILAIGGDSAVLKASRHGLPILAWNRGHLGFLTTGVNLEEILDKYVKNDLIIEKRRKLLIEIDGKDYTALNEIAIIGEETGHLVEIDLLIDGKQITTYKGDGLLVSTPTGSTAWSLSAGGSLVEFGIHCMLLTPMNPFTMNIRPLIVDSRRQIILRKVQKVVIDGHDIIKPQTNTVIIECDDHKYDSFVRIYKLNNESFFEAITEKLGWNYNIK